MNVSSTQLGFGSNYALPNDGTATDLQSGSCLSSMQGGPFGGWFPSGELRLPFSYRSSRDGFCGYTFTGNVPFGLYLIRGTDCEGTEKSCAPASASGPDYVAGFSFGAADDADYVVVLEAVTSLAALNVTVQAGCARP